MSRLKIDVDMKDAERALKVVLLSIARGATAIRVDDISASVNVEGSLCASIAFEGKKDANAL